MVTQRTQGNKRRHPRKIAAWAAWLRFHSSARYVKGRTKNVSPGGAYVVLPSGNGAAGAESPSVGDSVEFILGVPAAAGDHFIIEAVNGKADIVRVERGPGGGLALRFVAETDIE